MSYTVRPIENWPGQMTSPLRRGRSRFRASAADTQKLLKRELEFINAHKVVIQIDIDERDLKLDGELRANARPKSPAVIVAFQMRHKSEWVSLRYAMDAYETYDENLRAIALTLQALRAVERYGVAKGGEQYTGWKKLESGERNEAWARQIISQYGSIRDALIRSHPDHGGTTEAFRDVQEAREILGRDAA